MNSLSNKQQYLNLINYFDLLNSSDTAINGKSKGLGDITICVIDHGVIDSINSNDVEIPVHEAYNGLHPISFYRIRSNEFHNHWDNKYGSEHGTNVVGIIFANDNEKGSIGIAPNCSLVCIDKDCSEDDMKTISLKLSSVFSKLAEPKIQNNINWSKPVDVINCSWGMANLQTNLVQSIDIITTFGRKGLGIIACFASGNENVEISKNEKSYFAAQSKKVITVGAVKDKKRWIYKVYKEELKREIIYSGSNYGTELDICAPIDGMLTPSAEIGDIASLQRGVEIESNGKSSILITSTEEEMHIGCSVYIPICDIHGFVFDIEQRGDNKKIIRFFSEKIIEVENSIVGDFLYYSKYDEEKYFYGKYNKVIDNSGEFETERYYLTDYNKSDVLFKGRKVILIGFGVDYVACRILTILTVGKENGNFYVTLDNTIDIANGNIYTIYGDYIIENVEGTSFATPIVTGVAALMLSVNPNLNWLEVRKILRDTATKDNLILKDSKDGISHFKDGFCQAYGYGMVNAENAVIKAKGYGHYDLSIENVNQSNSKKITITVKNVAESNVSSIEGAELRCLLRYVSSDNPQFTFPDFWMENNIDTYLLDTKDIEALAKGDSVDYSIKKSEIEKYLKAIDKKKGIKPYLMFHVTPFDNADTRDNPNENNNLYVCLLEYNDTKFLDSTGEHRLQKRFEKTDTQLSCIIKIEPSVEGWDVTQKNMKLTIRMEYLETSVEYLFRFDTDDWCYENNNDGGISLQWNAESGNTHCTIPIGQDCEKIILSTEIDGYLKICTHEIRRKSAIFSKFTSALVEDMEFREKIYFFTDCDNLSNTKKYGAISSGDTDFQAGFDRYRITNVFAVEGTQETNTGTGTETTNETNSETSTPHKAYAVCKGKILVQEDKDDASLVNIVLKPEMHSSNNPAVKYFVYRGILKSSLYESDNSLKTNGNSVVSWIEKNIKEPDKRILGVELTDDAKYGDEAPIDNAFYNSDGVFELLTVPAGWCIGTFADNYIGFEIWLDTIGFNPTFSMIRNHETIIAVEQLPMNPTDGDISAHKAQKEQILNYMDPAAYFGNLYDDRIFVRNTNSEASRDGIEYSFEKVKKENLYTQIIDKFLNKNVVYIDIRNEFNTSYNYFGNYGNVLLKVLNNKNQPTPDDCYNCYGNSDWPIIATIFTPSFDDGVVKIAFKKGDNETPLAYAAIGERGRTIAEKIAQGKTNFVDLTAENGDYTDNSVAMVVPFRKNTAPNMENTYISVASYMRIDYLRRMKPKTPNNQETQEPQEQQEPQTPENTENLPVWKQRESSADLLFRPMDMKLPIENVTEGFVVKVYEDEVYIDVPEHQIDYMARMGIARDPDNTYLFAVKSDLHTKNAFQMSNPRFSICSGVNKITKEQFMKYVFGGNYTKKEVQFKDGTAYIVSYQSPILNDFMSNSNEIDMNREAELLVISNENYNKLLEKIHNGGFGENSIVYISLKKNECENYNEYTLSLQEVRASGIEEPSEPLLAIEIMKVLGDKA